MKEAHKIFLKKSIIKVLVCIILFLAISIFINYSDKNLLLYKNNVYDKTFNFSKVSKVYKKIFGESLPIEKTPITTVAKEIQYTSSNVYKDGASLNEVDAVYPYKSGIVVFLGNKEEYGYTIIIQGMDGIDYWYGNVSDVSIKLYDYVESSNVIANAIDNTLYVAFMKNGEFLNYEEYI